MIELNEKNSGEISSKEKRLNIKSDKDENYQKKGEDKNSKSNYKNNIKKNSKDKINIQNLSQKQIILKEACDVLDSHKEQINISLYKPENLNEELMKSNRIDDFHLDILKKNKRDELFLKARKDYILNYEPLTGNKVNSINKSDLQKDSLKIRGAFLTSYNKDNAKKD